MAQAPHNSLEDSRQDNPPDVTDLSSRDILTQGHVSDEFRARLNSFVYPAIGPNHSSHSPGHHLPTSSTMAPSKKSSAASPAKLQSSLRITRSGQKRSAAVGMTNVVTSPPVKKRRSTTKERSATDPHDPANKLVDSLRPGLILVLIGLNPGLTTALTGHAYAHPSNLYWKLLHWSGITPRQHLPSETHDLPDLYSIGNTNICARATRSGDGLSKEELIEGAGILEEKISRYKPETVCIVGKGIWDIIYKCKTGGPLKAAQFKYGWQDEALWLGRMVNNDGTLEWAGARTFVATTTSGLAASMTPQQKLAIWKPLGEWVQQRREEGVKQEADLKNEAEEDEEGKGEEK